MNEDYNGALICQTGVLGYLNNNFNYELSSVIRENNLAHLNDLFQYQSLLLHAQKTLVESAFSHSKWENLLLLLKLGFPFPEQFNIDSIPPQQHKLLEFVNRCQIYSELIKNNNFQEITKAIETRKISQNFRNLDNQSVITIAFLSESYEVYVLLKSKGFSQFINEVQLEVDKLPADAQFRIKRAMIAIAKEKKRCI